jgi:hypothetical protein
MQGHRGSVRSGGVSRYPGIRLNTPEFPSPRFRSQVLAEAEVQYAQPA